MRVFERDFLGNYLIIRITVCLLLLSSCGVRRTTVNTSQVAANYPTQSSINARPDIQPEPLKNLPELTRKEKALRAAFIDVLEARSADLPFSDLINRIYEKKGYQPMLVQKFFSDQQLQTLSDYLDNSIAHGLNPEQFFVTGLKYQLDEVIHQKSSDTVRIQRSLAKLELAVVNSLIRYSMAMQYGVTDPAKVYKNYAMPTLIPDSNSVTSIFEVVNLKTYLDSIQPKEKTYLALQKVLKRLDADTTDKGKDSVKIIIRQKVVVNMERLRWKNKPAEQKFVAVNIADFSLDVMDKDKSILHMKVCVGEPGDKQTPQIGSMIHSVQINPVWNIPQSIARNEISRYASDDKYYLSNNNIKVFKKGKLIRDPESIDWSVIDVRDYSFQQQPGTKNSLGKIKFLFKNGSSIYLHDTPVRSVFKRGMRAISHGCVRVEKPLDLAFTLFGKGEKYDQLKKGMESGYPRAKFMGLPQQIPVRLFYYTAWLNDKGGVRFGKDIYDLDQLVYEAMQQKQF
ncbi:L,D-transpeptidase family protein [Pedobacter cryoconitis]|uniref:L,D-transpeptidase-like protein n=1 Tax=Pedobacter cryoconitis TaxID=188932 RepID=A0A327RX36_9SPHI|nr:L,D-transpeptidase family protein [Pedobacter cryoconitis]RAJ21015.1 L,D-transpeptidase-like protein [Pedobacter cryoconitis]